MRREWNIPTFADFRLRFSSETQIGELAQVGAFRPGRRAVPTAGSNSISLLFNNVRVSSACSRTAPD